MGKTTYDKSNRRDDIDSYHIQWCPPNEHWPRGGWSVYQITGDQIASRIVRDAKGKVVERHSWCGYLGMADSFEGVQNMILADRKYCVA